MSADAPSHPDDLGEFDLFDDEDLGEYDHLSDDEMAATCFSGGEFYEAAARREDARLENERALRRLLYSPRRRPRRWWHRR